MRYTKIGEDDVSVIGLGAWQFGAREWGWDESRRADALRIVHRALELGINLIDTAELYGLGKSESILGEALAGRRERVFLASKIWPIFPTAGRIRRAAAGSLARLRMTQIDLYQVHWPNPLFPLAPQMRAMRLLQEAGQIRHVGVSNFNLRQWQRAEAELGRPVVANQVRYNLLQRDPERELLPWAQTAGRLIIAYSPLAQGLLAGKYGVENRPRDVRRFNRLFSRRRLRRLGPVLTTLREVAAAHQATPAQIALAWLISQPNVVAIPGARTITQVEENAAAGEIVLSGEERAHLKTAAEACLHPVR